MAGHQIINPFGEIIKVTWSTFAALDRRGYLHRDRESGLKGMDPMHAVTFIEAEFGTPWLYEIGREFKGAENLICRCIDCQRADC